LSWGLITPAVFFSSAMMKFYPAWWIQSRDVLLSGYSMSEYNTREKKIAWMPFLEEFLDRLQRIVKKLWVLSQTGVVNFPDQLVMGLNTLLLFFWSVMVKF
jgi:hypothetical protein